MLALIVPPGSVAAEPERLLTSLLQSQLQNITTDIAAQFNSCGMCCRAHKSLLHPQHVHSSAVGNSATTSSWAVKCNKFKGRWLLLLLSSTLQLLSRQASICWCYWHLESKELGLLRLGFVQNGVNSQPSLWMILKRLQSLLSCYSLQDEKKYRKEGRKWQAQLFMHCSSPPNLISCTAAAFNNSILQRLPDALIDRVIVSNAKVIACAAGCFTSLTRRSAGAECTRAAGST